MAAPPAALTDVIQLLSEVPYKESYNELYNTVNVLYMELRTIEEQQVTQIEKIIKMEQCS